jgi:hypothetical protein
LSDEVNLFLLGLVESSETDVGGSLFILEPKREFSGITCGRGVRV